MLVISLLVVVVFVGGCGDGEESADGGDREPEGAQRDSENPVNGGGAGESDRHPVHLLVAPAQVAPGDSIRVTVVNSSEAPVYFGLRTDFERDTGDEWVDANEEIYGVAKPGELLPLLSVEPGERSRRNESPVAPPIARDASPGTYRATVKVHTDRELDPESAIILHDTFTVAAS